MSSMSPSSRPAGRMTIDDEFPDEFAITPFDPAIGIRFKCGRIYRDREREIEKLEEVSGFKLPADFVEMIGDHCEGSFGGHYRVHLADDVEVWWTHLLFMKVATGNDEFFGYDTIALLRSVPELFLNAKGLVFFPFGKACAVRANRMANGFLVFEVKHGNSVAFVPYGRGKRIRIADSFRGMMHASHFVADG